MSSRIDSRKQYAMSGSTTSQRMERLMQIWREGEAAASQKLQAELAKLGVAATAAITSTSSTTPAEAAPSAPETLAATPAVSQMPEAAVAATAGAETSTMAAPASAETAPAAPEAVVQTAMASNGSGSHHNNHRGRRDHDRNDDDRGTSADTTDQTVIASRGGEKAKGGAGNDTLVDAGATGNGRPGGKDEFRGGAGDDQIHTRWGRDEVKAGSGNDVIYSRSDAGEPEVAQVDDTGIYFNNQPFPSRVTNDTLTGGKGDDTFVFRIDIGAKVNILAKHADKAGTIDWAAVTGENNLDHDHWVEAFGNDTITDFSRDGANGRDKIVITGHTIDVTDVVQEDRNGDGILDSVIKVISNQGPGGGAHNQDRLGEIVVLGDGTDNTKLTMADVGGLIQENAGAHHGLYENIDEMFLDANGQFPSTNYVNIDGKTFILGSKGSDSLQGTAGDDYMIDLGTWRDTGPRDTFNGGEGNDVIRTRWGRDTVDGGAGDDLIVSRSDAGEPVPAPAPGASAQYFRNQPFDRKGNDTLTGGEGADTFFFRLDLNAQPEVIARNLHDFATNHDHGDGDYSNIDWEGVTGENGATHLHWVESIGTDVITDFSRAEGDTIEIEGHTVEIASFTAMDFNRDGITDIVLQLRSQQGGPGPGGGAHDEDLVGRIVVLGDGTDDSKVSAADIGGMIKIDATVHHGAYGNIDEMLFV
jgi:Ca2+-binding RTX toxin-like protein